MVNPAAVKTLLEYAIECTQVFTSYFKYGNTVQTSREYNVPANDTSFATLA